jgi:ATP-dependent RNA helicase RhlE
MLDMGFIPSIRRITAALPKDRQTMCFSATMESSVEQLVAGCMHNPVRVALGSTLKPCSSVKLQAFQVDPEDKLGVLQQFLSNETGRCLVFTRTKRGTERLAKRLSAEGFAATMIHGNRTQSQRTAAMHGFQQGRFNVLVATDVASRGIHVDSIAHVINFDLPEVAEDFVHRVGRTGRAGERGVASTFITRDQVKELQHLERALNLRMERMRVRRVQANEARAV